MAEPSDTPSNAKAGPSSLPTLPAAAPTSDSQPVAQGDVTGSNTWTLPPKLTPRSVRPDILTDPAVLQDLSGLSGTATDPGRMGIWLCLKDDRAHLHPSLLALHKHRLAAHGIPIPAESNKTLPSAEGEGEEWISWKFSEEEEARRKAYLPLA